MKADSRLIKKESKIPKEKIYQFVLEDNTTEDIFSPVEGSKTDNSLIELADDLP